MRSLRFLSLFLFPAALMAVGCGEQNSPTDPGAASILADGAGGGELTANAGNSVVFSARGSGHLVGPTLGGTEAGWRTFTFNAIQRQDGTTTGHMGYNTHDQGDPAVTHKQDGRVFCMADLGNGLVAIGAEGTLRQPDDAPPVFAPFGTPLLPPATRPDDHGIFFVVRDNGEGASAAGPDQITGVVHTDLANVSLLCQLGANHPLAGLAGAFLNNVEAGNIQVTFP